MNMIKEFYNKLDKDKIQCLFNKNPIKMELFLSFLTCDVVQYDHHPNLCPNYGYTLYKNDDIKLYLRSRKPNNIIEYLDTIQYGHRLSNGYNNYVNPFVIFDILNSEGKKFFINYYEIDIAKIIIEQEKIVQNLLDKAMKEKEILYKMIDEKNNLFYSIEGV